MPPYVDDDYEVRDGEHIRVPMLLADAAAAAHRPGFRFRTAAAHEVTDFRGLRFDVMKRSSRDQYIQRTCDAWRGAGDDPDRAPSPKAASMAAPTKEPEPLPDPDLARVAYEQYRKALSMAWKIAPSATPWAAPLPDLIEAARVARLIAAAPPVPHSSAPWTDPRATSEIAAAMARSELGSTAGGPGPTDARAAYDAMVSRLRDAWRPRDWAEPDITQRPEERRRPHAESDPSDPDAAGGVEKQRERWLGVAHAPCRRAGDERLNNQKHPIFAFGGVACVAESHLPIARAWQAMKALTFPQVVGPLHAKTHLRDRLAEPKRLALLGGWLISNWGGLEP
jgi:hypothetical protein